MTERVNTSHTGRPSGGTPALERDRDTVAIPRPANELDGESAFRGRVREEPDEDPQKAG